LNKTYKLIFISVGAILFISLLFAIGFKDGLTFLIALGILAVIVGSINFIVGVILYAVNRQEWAKAFLISSGVLFLLGIGVCGPMFVMG